MTALLTTALIDRCHAGSRAKGFWDETPHPGTQLMLVISELSEAVEAHRKGRKVTCNAAHFAPMLASMADLADGARDLFTTTIKDTPADELADAYIRLCDYAGGYKVPANAIISHKNYWSNPERGGYKEPMDDVFAADLVRVVVAVVEVDNRIGEAAVQRLSRAFDAVEDFAQHYKIDLATHIDLKLAFNATRPAKHGKAY